MDQNKNLNAMTLNAIKNLKFIKAAHLATIVVAVPRL